jgi:hypothetical protein
MSNYAAYQTDYKRFEFSSTFCPNPPNPAFSIYKAPEWTNFRQVYLYVKQGSDRYTVAVPRDVTQTQFCAFWAKSTNAGGDKFTVEGMVDAAEFWLFVFGLVLIIWGILAWWAYYNNNCYVPLWYVLGLLVIGVYNIARSLAPAVSPTKTFASFYNA